MLPVRTAKWDWSRMAACRLRDLSHRRDRTLLRDHSSIFGVSYAGSGACRYCMIICNTMHRWVPTQKNSQSAQLLAGWLLGCDFAAATTMYPDARRIHADRQRDRYDALPAFGLQFCADLIGATATRLWQVAQRLPLIWAAGLLTATIAASSAAAELASQATC